MKRNNNQKQNKAMKQSNETTLIKQWYTTKYPSDDLGEEIRSNITFEDLFRSMDNYEDVYEFMGIYDSVIRERVFVELAAIMGVDYDYIYQQLLLIKV